MGTIQESSHQGRQIQIEIFRVKGDPANDTIHFVGRNKARHPSRETVGFQMDHERFQALEGRRGLSCRRGFIATECAQCSQLSVDLTGLTTIVQPALCHALGAAEVTAVHVVAVRGVAAGTLVEDVAFGEKRPAVAYGPRTPDFRVHCLLSFHGASAPTWEGCRDDGRAFKAAFRAFKAELLASFASFLALDPKAFLAAAQLLSDCAFAEAAKVGFAR